mmetsp:Transcript_24050/g.60011  ORF Transcript_24050/g.60011 Transcript_24050/m.60011 type:complete len:204 (-) Transcript_24050:849-1460(-)
MTSPSTGESTIGNLPKNKDSSALRLAAAAHTRQPSCEAVHTKRRSSGTIPRRATSCSTAVKPVLRLNKTSCDGFRCRSDVGPSSGGGAVSQAVHCETIITAVPKQGQTQLPTNLVLMVRGWGMNAMSDKPLMRPGNKREVASSWKALRNLAKSTASAALSNSSRPSRPKAQRTTSPQSVPPEHRNCWSSARKVIRHSAPMCPA